jgi:hypothetical protein
MERRNGCRNNFHNDKPRSMKLSVDKPNSVLSHHLPKQPMKRGSHFSLRPTHPVFTDVNLNGRLSFLMRTSGKRDLHGLAPSGVSLVAPKAPSHTRPSPLLTMRWSLTPPFHLFLPPKRRMYVFCDTIRFCRILPAEPSLAPLKADTRGTLPYGVRTFLPILFAQNRAAA